MKKLLLGSLLLAVITVFPVISMARVDVRINVPFLRLFHFIAPPNVVVLPGTDIYAVPDVEAEIFFRQGWWWRHWDNRWYRSRYYDRGWAYFQVIQPGIEGYLMTGEITIETICGEDVLGIIIPFLTVTWIDIGGVVIGETTMNGNILEDMAVIVVGMVVVPEDMVGIVVDTVVENKDKLFRKIYLYPITAGGRTAWGPGCRGKERRWT